MTWASSACSPTAGSFALPTITVYTAASTTRRIAICVTVWPFVSDSVEFDKTFADLWPLAPPKAWRWFDVFRCAAEPEAPAGESHRAQQTARRLLMPRPIDRRRQKLKDYRQRVRAYQ